MGRVSDHLIQLVQRQVDEHGLVVWFDAERAYEELVSEISLPEATLLRYEGSFYALRRKVDPYLEQPDRPRLVVYVPLGEEETQQALSELITLGTVLQPGQQPWQRNTRLAVIARAALRGVLPEERLAGIEREAQEGRLSLRELDQVATEKLAAVPAVLSVIFGTGEPQEVALTFLHDESCDEVLVRRPAMPQLMEMLSSTFDSELDPELSPQACRAAFAHHLLLTEFLASLGEARPAALARVRVAEAPQARGACVQLVRTWRLRRDLAESYNLHAHETEQAVGLGSIALSLGQLRGVETFVATEQALQTAVEQALLEEPRDELLEIAMKRRHGYWSSQRPEIHARWVLITEAGKLLREAARVEAEYTRGELGPGELALGYAEGDNPWCLLDTHQRRMEYLYQGFDYEEGAGLGALETLIARARQRYTEVAGKLAHRFVESLVRSDFQIEGVLRQRDIWRETVVPSVRRGKTAYLLVDALRYEMARELAASLDKRYEVTLHLAVATAPTITDVGMAALLPGAQDRLGLIRQRGGKLAVQVGEQVVQDRKDRMQILETQAPLAASDEAARAYTTHLERLFPPSQAVRKAIAQADLIVATSQDIDLLGESASVTLARRIMGELLGQLSRTVHILAEMGCQTIVITADHGHLFGEEAGSEMKIEPPGGETAILHRRVWVGRGGTADPSILRVALRKLGIETDLEMAVPWGLGVFRAGGSLAYHHGGLSPQEMLLPVLVVSPVVGTPRHTHDVIRWELVPGTKRIATGYFTVQVRGKAAGLFGTEPPRVRVEIHLQADHPGEERIISRTVGATYGHDDTTGEVELRWQGDDPRQLEPNTVTLQITERVPRGTASIVLLEAVMNRELARLKGVQVIFTV